MGIDVYPISEFPFAEVDDAAPYEQPESCWQCFGEGGWHDCGEDCCPCANPEIDRTCQECKGTGEL